MENNTVFIEKENTPIIWKDTSICLPLLLLKLIQVSLEILQVEYCPLLNRNEWKATVA